jgi:hypothetical protein
MPQSGGAVALVESGGPEPRDVSHGSMAALLSAWLALVPLFPSHCLFFFFVPADRFFFRVIFATNFPEARSCSHLARNCDSIWAFVSGVSVDLTRPSGPISPTPLRLLGRGTASRARIPSSTGRASPPTRRTGLRTKAITLSPSGNARIGSCYTQIAVGVNEQVPRAFR